MPDDHRNGGITFSREIRLGEVLAAAVFVASAFGVWSGLQTEVTTIKAEQRLQSAATDGMRQEFREVANRISVDVKEQGQSIRRIEGRLDRARM